MISMPARRSRRRRHHDADDSFTSPRWAIHYVGHLYVADTGQFAMQLQVEVDGRAVRTVNATGNVDKWSRPSAKWWRACALVAVGEVRSRFAGGIDLLPGPLTLRGLEESIALASSVPKAELPILVRDRPLACGSLQCRR